MSLADILIDINLLRKKLDDSFPLDFLDENDKLWKKFRLEWNYNSNHIEGNTLTYSETELLLFFDKTTGDHEKREYDEMQAHDVAIHLIKDWAKNSSRDISEADIRELNKTILVKPFWKEAITPDGQATRRLIDIGEYKKHPNSVRLKNGEMFHYASPQETPQMMMDLMNWYRNNEIQHALILASDLHYKFIRIHPFDDGNGRIARLLVNFVLMKNGYPPIIIKSKDKDKYITALNKADAGDISAFHEFMAEQLIWSLNISLKAMRNENIEEEDDLDKEIEILNRELKAGKPKTLPKSSQTITAVFETLLIPLFKEFESKLSVLLPNFYESQRVVHYSNFANSQSQFGTSQENIDQINQNFSYKSENEKNHIKSIIYNYSLIGFKFSEFGESIKIKIQCNFGDYSYSLQFNDQSTIKFPYGKGFKENEIKEFIKPVLKRIVKQIKHFIEKEKSK